MKEKFIEKHWDLVNGWWNSEVNLKESSKRSFSSYYFSKDGQLKDDPSGEVLGKWKKIVTPVLFIASMCLGFFVYPLDATFSSTMDKANINYKVPLELMYSKDQKETPTIDLRNGKHIIAFLSLTCPHCKIAAQKIYIMHKKNPDIPFYLALNGDKELLTEFFDETHAESIPHNLFLGAKDWIQIAGISLPIIMYVENSVVRKKCNGLELDQEDMETWLQK